MIQRDGDHLVSVCRSRTSLEFFEDVLPQPGGLSDSRTAYSFGATIAVGVCGLRHSQFDHGACSALDKSKASEMSKRKGSIRTSLCTGTYERILAEIHVNVNKPSNYTIL